MLKITPPLIIASGVGGMGEYLSLINKRYLGAYTLKTVTFKEKKGNLPPRMRSGDFYLLNRIGLENPGIDAFLQKLNDGEYDEIFSNTSVIASFGGDTLEEYIKIAEIIKPYVERFIAVEFNFSCPNVTQGGLSTMTKREAWMQTLLRIRKILPDTLLSAKIGIEGCFVEKAVADVRKSGWNCVTLLNTVRGLFIENGHPIAGGLSGPIMKPITLRAVYETKKLFKDIYVIASGGIMDEKDAEEMLIAGADAISLGTALFKDPHVVERIGRYLLKRSENS